MPGIFGIVPGGELRDEALVAELSRMARAMGLHPSYATHLAVERGVGLGRTGPGFLNPEPQPVTSADGSLICVFDGELFDPAAVRAGLKEPLPDAATTPDSHLVVRAIRERGPGAVAGLAGAYAGFVYDAGRRVGTLFTDRLGLRGCYYARCPDGTLLFASDFKGILAADFFRGRLDEQGVAEFLIAGFPFFDRTLFEEVKYLPHGSVLTISAGRLEVNSYWDFPQPASPVAMSFDDAVEEGARLLHQAVRRQLRPQGRIGVLLSGGMDSRAIAALAVQAGARPSTFSLGSLRNTEQRLAARVASRLQLDHHHLEIPADFLCDFGRWGLWCTDAMFPINHMHWLAHLETIGAESQAILSGYLGGVFLGGVFLRPEHLALQRPEDYREKIVRQLTTAGPLWDTALNDPWRQKLSQAYARSVEDFRSRIGDRGSANELDRMYMHTDERRFTNLGNLGMIGSVADVKFPFGDYDLLDLYSHTPPPWRLGSRLYKRILCRAMPELLDIPVISANTRFIETRIDAEPSRLALRWARTRKLAHFALGRLTGGRLSLPDRRTYVHYAHWFRTVPRLRNWIESILLDERTLSRGYVDRGRVRQLLEMERRTGYVFDKIARLVTFEMWNRFFVDKEPPPEAMAGTNE